MMNVGYFNAQETKKKREEIAMSIQIKQIYNQLCLKRTSFHCFGTHCIHEKKQTNRDKAPKQREFRN